MSKIFMAFGVCLFDAVAAVLSVVQSSGGLIVLVASIITSFAAAMVARTVGTIFCPEYFWNEQNS